MVLCILQKVRKPPEIKGFGVFCVFCVFCVWLFLKIATGGKAAPFTREQDENACRIGAALVLSKDLATQFTFVTDSADGLSINWINWINCTRVF